MQKLTLNIIPFKHPSTLMEFGFYKEKKDEYYPLKKYNYPRSLWENYEEELQDCNRLYSNFKDKEDCDFIATVDLSKSFKFADHYYTKSIYNYFLKNADAVRVGFVNDVEVWLKDNTAKNTKYTTYKKYSLRVQFAQISSGMELVITYNGTSLVHKKSILDFDNLPQDLINNVIYQKNIYDYQEDNQKLNVDLKDVYPVLSNPLLKELAIKKPYKRVPNKYKLYLKEIDHFYNTYLDNDTFKNIIPLSQNGFLEIDDTKILKTNNNSNELLFANGKTGRNPKVDFLKLKPYKASTEVNIRFVFIYHKDDKEKYVKKLFKILKDGLPSSYNGFPPMREAINKNYFPEQSNGFEFSNIDTALEEISQQLSTFEKVDNTLYVAFYISPIKKDEKDFEKYNLYFKMKELFLQQGITSQVIYKETIFEKSLNWTLNNIAVALVAKTNGIPWKLNTETKDDLIVGVGAFRSKIHKLQYIGSTFCFNNDGTFQDFNCFNSNETEKLAGEISKAILQYIDDNKKQAKRLVIHFYKKISKEDLKPIYDVLHNHKWDIPVIVITINKKKSNDYVAFDMSNANFMPQSGTIIPIGSSQYLLFNNTRYRSTETVSDNPFPIKLTFSASEEVLLTDKVLIKELIEQIYQYSRMYWKSVRQQSLPVTIKYPEMVAEIYPYFKNDSLPPFGRKNLWFL